MFAICHTICNIKHGWTPLFNAAEYDHVNVVKYLVEKAKVNLHHVDKVLSMITGACKCAALCVV